MCRGIPQGAGFYTAMRSAMRLGSVLNDLEAVFAGNRHDAAHVGALPVEMNRQNRPGSGSNGLFDPGRIKFIC